MSIDQQHCHRVSVCGAWHRGDISSWDHIWIDMAELEGFLCPLCKQDCLSVQELEAHYREAHEASAASKFKRDFVSFFENAFNISPKQGRAKSTDRSLGNSGSTDGDNSVQEPVTNVCGINKDSWDPQEMGKALY